jgi:4-amino-4-deoxy-L-arabinose transferase-like glycosyltransferase
MKSLRSVLTLPAISVFLVALLVRFVYNETVTVGYYPLHDSLTYQTIAINILQQHCFCELSHLPTVDRAPLWPAVIAAIYAVIGVRSHAILLFLSLVGSGTCLLVYYFARDLFGTRVGLIAGLIAAIYPFLFIYDGWLYSESLYIFLLLAFCYSLFRLQRTPRWQLMVVSGILLGLASLERPNGVATLALFFAWLAVMLWTKVIPRRKVLQSGVVVTLLFLAFVTPWLIRNYLVAHTFVFVATGDGKVLVGAYNKETDDIYFSNKVYLGTWLRPEESVPNVVKEFPAQCAAPCEVARDNAYKATALQWIKQHPKQVEDLLKLHIAGMWATTSAEADLPLNRFPGRISSILVVDWMKIITPIIFALAALGFIVTLKRWRELFFIYLVILETIAECIVFYGIPRFRAPIEPLLILLAAGALWWLFTIFSRKGRLQSVGA